MQAEPAFQAAEVFWMEMLVSTAFFSLLAAVSVRDIWYCLLYTSRAAFRTMPDRLRLSLISDLSGLLNEEKTG